MRVRIVALERGPDRNVVGVFTRTNDGGLVLEEYARVEPAGANPAGAWATMCARAKRGACAIVTPAPNLTFAKYLEVPPLPQAQRERVVRFEASQAIPRPLEELVWAWAPVPGAGATRVELAAMKHESAEALAAEAESAGVRLAGIFGRATVLGRALQHNYPELRGRAVLAEVAGSTALLVADLGGANAVRLVGLPEFARVPAGGGGEGAAADHELRARRLVMEVRRLVDESAAERPVSPITLLLAGADTGGLETADFGASGALATVRFDALRRVRVGAGAGEAAAIAEELAAVVGAALAAGDRTAPNLLPAVRRRENAFRRARWRWVVAGAGAAVAVWSTALGLRVDVGRTRLASAALVRELEPWRAAQREVARGRQEAEECARELETIAALQRARTGWARFLGGCEQRIAPGGGLWLESWRVAPAGEGGGWARGSATVGPDGVARKRIAVTGCALDPGPDGRRGLERVRELWRDWARDERVAGVESERFDHGTPGLLRFSGVVVLKPEAEL